MRDFKSAIGIPLAMTVALIAMTPSEALAELHLGIIGYGEVIYDVGEIPDVSAEMLVPFTLDAMKKLNPDAYKQYMEIKKVNPAEAAEVGLRWANKWRQEWIKEVKGKGYKAAYMCSHFALFWADMARWKCEPVVMMAEEQYMENAPDVVVKAIGEKYSQSDIKMGFWKKHGRWIVGAALIGFIIFSIMKKSKKSRSQAVFADGGGQIGSGQIAAPDAVPPTQEGPAPPIEPVSGPPTEG